MVDERIEKLTRRLTLIDRAMESPVWTELLLPEIQAKRQEHQAACFSRELTAEKRAEHIEAVHLAEYLAGILISKKRQTEHSIAAIMKQKAGN